MPVRIGINNFMILGNVNLRTSEIHLFYNLQLINVLFQDPWNSLPHLYCRYLHSLEKFLTNQLSSLHLSTDP
jgi:hypothetical protein